MHHGRHRILGNRPARTQSRSNTIRSIKKATNDGTLGMESRTVDAGGAYGTPGPGLPVAVLESVGHMPNVEAAEAFNRTVLGFLPQV